MTPDEVVYRVVLWMMEHYPPGSDQHIGFVSSEEIAEALGLHEEQVEGAFAMIRKIAPGALTMLAEDLDEGAN